MEYNTIYLPDGNCVLLGSYHLSKPDIIDIEDIDVICDCTDVLYDNHMDPCYCLLDAHFKLDWTDSGEDDITNLNYQSVYWNGWRFVEMDVILMDLYEYIKNGKRVAIHCQAGVSRSVALLCMLLIRHYGLSYQESIKLIRRDRSVADPNPYYVSVLSDFK